MIIDRNRHHLFCLLLSDHIFIERRLDLVRCRDLLNVDNRLRLRLRLFLLQLLIVRQSALQIRQIDHADVRNSSHVHIHHIIHGKTASVHAVKRLLHTVLADADIVRNTDHLSRNMFRSSTDVADVLILRVLIPVCVIRSGTLCHLSGA